MEEYDPYVSIHVPARGTTASGNWTNNIITFQSTFPQGERLRTESDHRSDQTVSIHVPARGTTLFSLFVLFAVLAFQSTFPQGERHDELGMIWGLYDVSIHVPARGTTLELNVSPTDSSFQSTFPQGERPRASRPRTHVRIVSIHVPARGTTGRDIMKGKKTNSFNPRSRKGNDCMDQQHLTKSGVFQSTFPQGERRAGGLVQQGNKRFQSTFPQGERRNIAGRSLTNIDVSIHVPARGTTNVMGWNRSQQMCFNPRSRKGNDLMRRRRLADMGRFNPRSRKGNDHQNRENECNRFTFQSTFPQGERPIGSV